MDCKTPNSTSIALACLACATAALAQDGGVITRVVASVNGQAILSSQVVAEMDAISANLEAAGVNVPEEQQLYDLVLENMIEDALQRQRVRELGIVVTDEAVDAAISNIVRGNNNFDIEEHLQASGQTMEQFRQSVRDEIALNQAVRADNQQELSIGRREVDEELRARMSGSDTREYKLEHALLPPEREDLALAASALAGEDFGDFAREHSISDEDVVLGWRTVDELPSAFVEIVSRMRPGEVSDAVELGNGHHVLHLLATRPFVPGHTSTGEVRLKVLRVGEGASPAQLEQAVDGIVNGAGDFDSVSELVGGTVDVVELAKDHLPPDMSGSLRLRTGEVGGPFELDGGTVIVQVLDSSFSVAGAEDLRQRASALAAEDNFFQVRRKWIEYLRFVGTVEIVRADL